MIDNLMTSSQRLVDYTELDGEDEVVKISDKKHVDTEWP
jgi:hypothetical protein